MKMMKWIFNVVCALMLISVVPAMAAVDNGCSKEENDRINPALALCTTHAYNIKETQNPSGVNKQVMRDVVAMKTTVMTQQMNKQYEYLEAMIRRFKTQLEKAVLTTGLEAKGASTSSASGSAGSSYQSSDRNMHMAGVENCNEKISPLDVLTCLNKNMNTISNATQNVSTDISSNVRKQFVQDYNLLVGIRAGDVKCWEQTGNEKNDMCATDAGVRKKKDFQKCFDQMRSCLRNKSYELEQDSRRNKKD